MDVSCVHADRETTVARKMGIKVIPSVVLLLDSHPYHYRESSIAANKVICMMITDNYLVKVRRYLTVLLVFQHSFGQNFHMISWFLWINLRWTTFSDLGGITGFALLSSVIQHLFDFGIYF